MWSFHLSSCVGVGAVACARHESLLLRGDCLVSDGVVFSGWPGLWRPRPWWVSKQLDEAERDRRVRDDDAERDLVEVGAGGEVGTACRSRIAHRLRRGFGLFAGEAGRFELASGAEGVEGAGAHGGVSVWWSLASGKGDYRILSHRWGPPHPSLRSILYR